jgi:hypothetical protein
MNKPSVKPPWPEFVERWLIDLAAGYQIEQLLHRSGNDLRGNDLVKAGHLANRLLDSGLTGPLEHRPRDFRELPIPTLEQIKRLNHSGLGNIASKAKTALNSLVKKPKNSTASILLQSKLVANRLRSGTHTFVQIKRLFTTELGLNIDDFPVSHAPLGAFIHISAQPNTSFQKQVSAVQKISESIPDYRWKLIENSFLHSWLTWPLLVAIDETKDGSSLPLLIDVEIPTEIAIVEKKLTAGPFVEILPVGTAKVSEGLRASVKKSLIAAIGYWRNNNKGWDPDIHERVQLTTGKVDFSYLQKIQIHAGFPNEDPFSGRSLEACLTLAFLGRLFNSTAGETTCATGVIGKRSYQGCDDDFYIGKVGGQRRKLKYVGISKLFDRAIFPDSWDLTGKIVDKITEKSFPTHVTVKHGKFLSDYVNITFPGEGGRHQFIRCPDLEHAWNNDHSKYSANEEDINAVSDLIAKSKSSVLNIPARISAHTVARSLFLANHGTREYAKALNEKVGGREIGETEFLQSFVFIRATNYETNDRFWRVIWEVLSGRKIEWERFSFAVSRPTAARELAKLMNRKLSTPYRMRRVPDKIIIIGSDRLSRSERLCPNGPFSRLQLESLLPALEKNLSRIKSNKHVLEYIGRPRIILVPGDDLVDSPGINPANLPEDIRSAFVRLSIFQYGFTFENAKVILSRDDLDCRRILDMLEKYERDGVRLLLSPASRPLAPAPPGGKFLLNFKAKTKNQPNDFVSNLHFEAALAISGFPIGDEMIQHTDYERVFAPENSHDAQDHLKKARKAAKKIVNQSIKGDLLQRIQSFQSRLSALSEPFSWNVVRWAAVQPYKSDQAQSDIALIDTAMEYINDRKRRVKTEKKLRIAHPIEICHLIMLRWKLLRRVNDPRDVVKMRAEIEKLYDLATSEANKFPVSKVKGVYEIPASKFAVATTIVACELRNEPQYHRAKSLRKYIEVADKAQRFAYEILDVNWYLYRGDMEHFHEAAEPFYYQGYFDNQIPGIQERQNVDILVKYVGAMNLQGKPISNMVEAACLELTQNQIDYIAKNLKTGNGLKEDMPQERWQKGRSHILKLLVQKFEKSGDQTGGTGRGLAFYLEGIDLFEKFIGLPSKKLSAPTGEYQALNWYLYRGDMEFSNEAAMPFYYQGYFDSQIPGISERQYVDLLVKYIGSMQLDSRPIPDKARTACLELDQQELGHISQQKETGNGVIETIPQERWQAGRSRILEELVQEFEKAGDNSENVKERLNYYRGGVNLVREFMGLPDKNSGWPTFLCALKYFGLAKLIQVQSASEVVKFCQELSQESKQTLFKIEPANTRDGIVNGKLSSKNLVAAGLNYLNTSKLFR